MAYHRYKTLAEAFWSHVTPASPDDCWLWQGATFQSGYGRVAFQGVTHRAHRLSFDLHYGPVPADALVLHRCPGGGTPLCVNPLHLALGTNKDNSQDMVDNMRSVYGVKQHLAKLTPDKVHELRSLALTHTLQELHDLFHLEKQTIAAAVQGKTWKEVEGALPSFDFRDGIRGSKHGQARLTEDKVRDIRALASLYNQHELARMFHVSVQSINNIIHRKSWKHVT